MSDEDELSRMASRGVRAKSLLENELLSESHAKIEADLIAGWIASEPRDTEFREAAWRMIHANRKHRDFLQSVANNGKLAAAELKSVADTAARKKRFGIV